MTSLSLVTGRSCYFLSMVLPFGGRSSSKEQYREANFSPKPGRPEELQ